jgi:hypothetical protein
MNCQSGLHITLDPRRHSHRTARQVIQTDFEFGRERVALIEKVSFRVLGKFGLVPGIILNQSLRQKLPIRGSPHVRLETYGASHPVLEQLSLGTGAITASIGKTATSKTSSRRGIDVNGAHPERECLLRSGLFS